MRALLQHLKTIEKKSFRDIEKAYYFFRFKYPKFFLLIISLVAAYLLFTNPIVSEQIIKLKSLSYLGTFFAGVLFAFGFTAAFAVGFFIALNPQNIFLAAIIGGIGTLLANLLVFRLIKTSFIDEFNRLKHEHLVKEITKLIKRKVGLRISNYVLYLFAGIIIASPLPDEIGITMLAGLTSIRTKILGVITFLLSTLGIYIILYLSN